MGYVTAIKTAIIFFPFIAFLFTIPFILHQYHKYGSIHKLRVLIIYSFILYMISIYFLVILPLPNRNEITKTIPEMINLKLFSFVKDIINESPFVLKDPHTYLQTLAHPSFYTVAFNIIMTIPFGMYLRYYFKCGFGKVLVFSFLLSLFFEITQLTGLYFIYPGPYRLFDVDDLLMNTLGGCLGYFIMGWFKNILPTREQIDKDSFEQGIYVSGLKRITLFSLDFVIYIILVIFLKFTFDIPYISIIMFIVYYGIIPAFMNGKTLGCKFLNVKNYASKYLFLKLILKNMFLYFYYFGVPFLLFFTAVCFHRFLDLEARYAIILYLLIGLVIIFYYIINVLILLISKKNFYDYIFKVDFISTIKRIDEEDKESN